MKNTSMKNTKITKSEYHESVSPAFCAWRKAMHKACGVTPDMYCRLFTEKRSHGARTKYYMSYNDLPNTKIANYIKRNPTFTADGVEYKVIFQANYIAPVASRYGTHHSALLFAERITTNKSK